MPQGEPNFTPGTWRVRSLPDDWDAGGPDRGNTVAWAIGTDSDVVAVVYGDYDDRAQGKADASLIAASKALYAALAEMVETYREDGSDDDEQPAMVRAALHALAKSRA